MTSTIAGPKDALNPTLEEAAATVATLVQEFSANDKYYLSPSYLEAEVRDDFIDKFLFALGWDVNHTIQKNPFQQEVKVERHVQMATAQRRADYALSLEPNFDSPVLYVEAKKPAVEIATPDNYFQIIRYANQRGHALGVLTDFEQLHIIDCRFQANIDTASHRAVKKYHYSDFVVPDKFAEIFYLLSRPAIADGSLEKYAATLPKPKGRPGQKAFIPLAYKPIDERLLEKLDELRSTLARALKTNNPQLDSAALTELTQRIIDRLVLIRFLEDKLIEPDPIIPTLGESTNRSAWQDFRVVCRKLDKTYNGIVYKFHTTLDAPNALKIDDKNFADVLDAFDYHKSEYLFNDIPLHILGSIYERFLGNVIVATKKRATLEPKPEVRKAGGVYYTPKYIVDYIVQNTVGKLIDGKTPGEISKMRFADIACGSGSFLLGVYDCILKYVTRWYNEHSGKAPKSAVIKRNNGLYLSIQEKGRILTDNIYGVDIDPQAVEVAQLSLYLKLLEEETTASARQYTMEFHRPLLPSLADNIKCGNSLISSDFYENKQLDLLESDHRKINAFDWHAEFPDIMRAGGFDAVIGNPPYLNIRILTQVQSEGVKEYFERRFNCAHRGYDLYILFIEQSYRMLCSNGMFGMIVPNKLGTLNYAERCRELLLGSTTLHSIADVSKLRVFSGASVYPYVVVYQKRSPTPDRFIEVIIAQSIKDLVSPSRIERLSQSSLNAVSGFAIHGNLDVEERVPTKQLGEISNLDSGTTGFVAQKMSGELSERDGVREPFFDFIVSGNINRYSIQLGSVRFMKHFFDYPVLPKHSTLLTKRKLILFENTKIVIAGMTRRLEAGLDRGGLALGVQVFALSQAQTDYGYLLGILNSKLMSHLFRIRFQAKHLAGGFLAINKGQLTLLPIRTVVFSNKSDKAKHDQVVDLAQRMLDLHKQLPDANTDHTRTLLQRQIDATDRQIDKLVYELYALTDDEIRIVEEATTR